MSNSIGNPSNDRDSQQFWSDRIEQAVRTVSWDSAAPGVVRWPDKTSHAPSIESGSTGCKTAADRAAKITGADSCVKLLLPGSFNPLHLGHIRMAEFANQRLGLPAWFELSLANADKPLIDAREATKRLLPSLVLPNRESNSRDQPSAKLGQLPGQSPAELDQNCEERILKKSPSESRSIPSPNQKPVVQELRLDEDRSQDPGTPDETDGEVNFFNHGLLLTSAATYVEKGRLFPECTFALGVDTMARVADVRYYGGEVSQRDTAINELRDLGCHFLVFGRLIDNCFVELPDIELPQQLRRLCDEVSSKLFRVDLSSSQMRQ